jgi:hypothetical protein
VGGGEKNKKGGGGGGASPLGEWGSIDAAEYFYTLYVLLSLPLPSLICIIFI